LEDNEEGEEPEHTTEIQQENFHLFLWQLLVEKFKTSVDVTHSGRQIKITLHCLLPATDVLTKLAAKLSRYKSQPQE